MFVKKISIKKDIQDGEQYIFVLAVCEGGGENQGKDKKKVKNGKDTLFHKYDASMTFSYTVRGNAKAWVNSVIQFNWPVGYWGKGVINWL